MSPLAVARDQEPSALDFVQADDAVLVRGNRGGGELMGGDDFPRDQL